MQQRRLQLKANMMYQFVHGVRNIPEDILLLHPPSNYDTCNCSYFQFPMLEQMLIIVTIQALSDWFYLPCGQKTAPDLSRTLLSSIVSVIFPCYFN